jgi:hypothetical protein
MNHDNYFATVERSFAMTEENAGKQEPNQPPLVKAVGDLEKAEADLARARSDEAAAEKEVAEAIHEIEEAEQEHVEVHVVHVNEAEKASFKEKITATLGQVWDKSYIELKIARKPKDVFQTGGEHPKSLVNDLQLTLREARERGVITNYHFGIASETGGA